MNANSGLPGGQIKIRQCRGEAIRDPPFWLPRAADWDRPPLVLNLPTVRRYQSLDALLFLPGVLPCGHALLAASGRLFRGLKWPAGLGPLVRPAT
jgi:hypothetical protein